MSAGPTTKLIFHNWFQEGDSPKPGLCVPKEDESGSELWGPDPVHPLYEGYNCIIDVCNEATKLRKKSRASKREGGQLAPPPKRPRVEVQRPSWITETTPCREVSVEDSG